MDKMAPSQRNCGVLVSYVILQRRTQPVQLDVGVKLPGAPSAGINTVLDSGVGWDEAELQSVLSEVTVMLGMSSVPLGHMLPCRTDRYGAGFHQTAVGRPGLPGFARGMAWHVGGGCGGKLKVSLIC